MGQKFYHYFFKTEIFIHICMLDHNQSDILYIKCVGSYIQLLLVAVV